MAPDDVVDLGGVQQRRETAGKPVSEQLGVQLATHEHQCLYKHECLSPAAAVAVGQRAMWHERSCTQVCRAAAEKRLCADAALASSLLLFAITIAVTSIIAVTISIAVTIAIAVAIGTANH